MAKKDVYNGKEPYIFVSYAHKDTEKVLPIIKGLQDKGFRVWYDGGIEVGTEWPEYIADHLCDSYCVIVFMSQDAVKSQYCRKEINLAIDEQKEIITVYLEKCELSRGLRMSLNSSQALFCYRLDNNSSVIDTIAETDLVQKCLSKKDVKDSENTKLDVSVSDVFGDKSVDQFQKEVKSSWKENIEPKHTTDIEVAHSNEVPNSVEAYYMQGDAYYYGKGVPQDYEKAVECYRKAAEQGHSDAQGRLGECYYYGYGVPQDYEKAVECYRKAAEQGDKDAQSILGVCYFEGIGVKQSDVEAVKWYTKAAEQGEKNAQYTLGWCYYFGNGVEQNYAEAEKWVQKASEQGQKPAKRRLKKVNWHRTDSVRYPTAYDHYIWMLPNLSTGIILFVITVILGIFGWFLDTGLSWGTYYLILFGTSVISSGLVWFINLIEEGVTWYVGRKILCCAIAITLLVTLVGLIGNGIIWLIGVI